MRVSPHPDVCQDLLDGWRRQIARRARRRHCQPRRLGAIGYLTSGPALDGLIELQNLVLTVLYDQPCGHQSVAVRAAGFAAEIVPWGIEWGGPEKSRFLKNLTQRPARGARGRCIDLASTKLLELALELDRQVERRSRRRYLPIRRQLRLPSHWVGFHKSAASELTFEGPELERFCLRINGSVQDAVERKRREHYGLVLYPLEWVSHVLQSAVTVFADLNRTPACQVFQLHCPSKDLVGYSGAVKFDFYSTRFDRAIGPASAVDAGQKAAS